MGETNTDLNEELKKIKTRGLTLDPDAQDIPAFPGSAEASAQELENFSAGAIDESMLSEDEKKQVEEFAGKIDITDVRMLNSYGAAAQKGIAAFSTSITRNVKTKEFGEIGQSLRDLRSAINSTAAQPQKKGIFGLFQKGKAKITYMVSNYESAETNIRKIEKDLQFHQKNLTKDVFLFDQMYDMNMEFYKELTMYIIAGKKALYHARSTQLLELQKKAEQAQDQLDIQKYRDYNDACTRFEKRIYDLESTRMLSIQQAPQIRMLQNADQEVVDKLRSDIINTIPLWRNQMVLALGITHTRNALDAQAAVTEMTNEMFARNAETLKQGAIDAAAASEKGIIDIETIQKVNSEIIASINEVVKIHEEGSKKRTEASEELAKIEGEFKQALLEAGGR